MVFTPAESLKSQYTDKYVKVDASRPELARFRDVVGQVKTVNMNGRALVEFLDYHLNIGWFDIDPKFLTVVDKPSPALAAKPEAKREHDKPVGKAAPTTGDKQTADAKALAGGKKLSPLELARMQGAGAKGAAPAKPAESAKPAPAGAKKSTADILAAARGGAEAPAKPAAAAPATEAAKTPAAPAAPAKPAGGKMSTADILAAARGKADAPAAPAAPAPAPATPPKAEATPPKAEAPTPAATPAAAEPASGGVVKVDRSSMTVQQMIDYCHDKDAK
jgi:hypothetical protein